LLLSAGACSTASAAVDRYLSADAGGAKQQTRRASLLLSIDGTDRRTDVLCGQRQQWRGASAGWVKLVVRLVVTALLDRAGGAAVTDLVRTRNGAAVNKTLSASLLPTLKVKGQRR